MKKIPKIEINSKEAGEALGKRSLDKDFPELLSYLKPGLKVLDVGCGPGSVTLNVAETVNPGEVVGIDAVEDWVEDANNRAGKQNQSNITYRHMDAHDLVFSDDHFDVTYSRQAMQYFIDPVRCLREQKRVTKKGGWVYAKMADLGIRLMYPSCPEYYEVLDARGRYAEYLSKNFKPGDQIRGFFMNPYIGRRCVEFFTKAGLDIDKVEILPPSIIRPGVETFESKALAKQFRLGGAREEYYRGMIDAGYLDEGTLERARQATEAWCEEPYAFMYEGSVRVAAKV